MKCPHCSADKMTIAEFKKAFAVGDLITGWSTGKVVQISAIGEQRFLYTQGGYRSGKEYVCAIQQPFLWKKVQV